MCDEVGLASKWAARRALKALWTSLARLGGRLSFLLRPRLEDMGSKRGWWVVLRVVREGSGEGE